MGPSRSHPKCGIEHICQVPTGKECIEIGCHDEAGTRWGPMWCPKHDQERLDRVSTQMADLAKRGFENLSTFFPLPTEKQLASQLRRWRRSQGLAIRPAKSHFTSSIGGDNGD